MSHSHGHSHGEDGCPGHGGHPHAHSHGDLEDQHSHMRDDDGNGDKSDEIKEAEHFCDVIAHYENYASHCFRKFDKMQKDFDSIKPHLRKMVPNLEYKLQEVRKAVVANQAFIRKIVTERGVFHNPHINYRVIQARPWMINEERASKVRSTLRQCVRDWSAQGKCERDQCYKPILDELERLYPDVADRGNRRVLVPGCGLARLTWEVANRGFFSQGNEFSYYMLLCSYFLLNMVECVENFEIYPWLYNTKNLLKTEHQLASVRIPDVDPSSLPPTSQFSMVAGDFTEIFNDQHGEWDCVASCFFIDTARNILEYLELVSNLLKIGGYLINFGPLLYHFADMHGELSLELSYEELKEAFGKFGLELIKEETGLPSVYTGHPTSMLKQEYRCVFFTCVKRRHYETFKPPALSEAFA